MNSLHASFFINVLDEETEHTLSKFVDDTKLVRVADTPEACATIQRDLDRLESWMERNLMRFSKGKCSILHLGRTSPRHEYRLGAYLLESSSVERDLRVMVDNKLTVSQQCALVARKVNGILTCIKKSMDSMSRKSYPFPLLNSGEATPGVCSSGLPSTREMLESVQYRATKMIKGLKHLSCEERLSELGLFSLRKRRLRGDLINLYKYLRGQCKRDGAKLSGGQ